MYGTDGEVTRPPEPGTTRPPASETASSPEPETARPPAFAATHPPASDATAEDQRGTARESTGDERVDAAMARLGELDGAPTASHPEIFQDVHRRLQETLTGIDGEQP